MEATPGNEPAAGRPTGPRGYFDQRPLPWTWARQLLIDSRNYWVVSVRADGRPHSRPVWGVWLDDVFYFDSASQIIGSNVDARPDVTVHLESGDRVVIIEGAAERVTDPTVQQRFLDVYNPKYNSALTAPPGVVFAVRPRLAFGWLSDPTGLDGGAIYGSTGTRWDFRDIAPGA